MDSITSDQRRQFNRFTQDGARKALTTVNPDKGGLQRLFGRGDEWQDYLIAGIARFTAKTPDYSLAHSILGADFITPEEVTEAYPSIMYTDDQITALARNLPSEDVLKWCKYKSYAVMPAPPSAVSTLDIRDIPTTHFYTKSGGWYVGQKFAREDKTSFGWLVIKKTPISDSTSKNWVKQNKLLTAFELVPNAAEMSWFITTYFEVRGIRLFENVYVRTSSLSTDGGYIDVGGFDSEGLRISDYGNHRASRDMGLSAARKF